MKTRVLYVICMLLLVVVPTNAQKRQQKGDGDREKWRKEMREFKLKFLAQEIALQPDQQKQFFTLYTQMSDEKEALMRNTHQIVERVEKMTDPTDADYRAASEALISAREQEIAIDRRYEEKFKTFLTPKQLFKLKGAERKFLDKLSQMRHQHHSKPPKKK